jgi:hypothetical protein
LYIEDANKFLEEYKYELSDKFAVRPTSPHNAHRPLTRTEDELDVIFSIHAKRCVSKNLEIRYENAIYKIDKEGMNLTMQGCTVTVCKDFNRKVSVFYKGKQIQCKLLQPAEKQITVESAKTINRYLDKIIKNQIYSVKQEAGA